MGFTAEQDDELRVLIRDAQAGMTDSYARALVICAKMLEEYFRGRLMDRNAAEDVVQETLISLHSALHTFNPVKPFAPWFFSIARSRLIDHLRKERRYRSLMQEQIDQVREVALSDRTGDGAALLKSLPERQREVLELLKLKDLSVKQVAAELNMSESSVKVTAHRAYKAIRARASR